MKRIIKNLSFALLVSFGIISCNTDDKSVSSDQTNTEYSFSQDGKSVTFNYKTEKEKNEILLNLSTEYIESIYLVEDIDTRYQISGAIIQENKANKTLEMVFETVNLGDMTDEELVFFMMAYPIDYNDNKGLQSEKLQHYCDGGTQNGSSLTLDRPKGPVGAMSYGKKVAEFAQNCLNGGGCLQICNAYVEVLPNLDKIKIDESIFLQEYKDLLDKSKLALSTKLELKIKK